MNTHTFCKNYVSTDDFVCIARLAYVMFKAKPTEENFMTLMVSFGVTVLESALSDAEALIKSGQLN